MLEHLIKWLSFFFFFFFFLLDISSQGNILPFYSIIVILQKFKPWQVTDCFKSSHLRNSKLLDVVKTNGYLSNNVNSFYVIKNALNLNFLHLVPLIYISETFKLLDVFLAGKRKVRVYEWWGERGRHLLPFTRGQLTVGAMTPCQLPKGRHGHTSVLHC